MHVAKLDSKQQPTRSRNGKSLRQRIRSSLTAWLYILPAGAIMLVISFFPQAYQVWMSFTDFRIGNLRFNFLDPATYAKYAPEFVGLENYIKVLLSRLALENYDFGRLFAFNVTWTVANIVFHVGLGVLIAMALNSKFLIGRRFYRAIFIIPWALPAYITALTWHNMYDDRFGAINQLLVIFNDTFGTDFATNIRWIEATGSPIGGIFSFLPLAFYAVLVANVWLGWPFMTVVATGALQSIPGELYEAAEIDGASGWQKFVNITIPLIRPAMVPAIMLGTIWTFNQFNVIYFITEGKPFNQTEILITQAFKLVFEQRLYGVAAAFSIIVFFILLVLTLLQNWATRATEAYDVA